MKLKMDKFEKVFVNSGARMRERWCKSMYENPRTHCGVACLVILFTSGLALGVYPVLYGEDRFDDLGAQAQITFDAIELARELADIELNEYEDSITRHDFIQFFYESYDEVNDIFTAGNLQKMCQFERSLILKSAYGFGECDILTDTDTCVSSSHPSRGQTSIAKKFYLTLDPAFNYQECALPEDAEVERFAQDLYFGLQNDTSTRQFDGIFVNSDIHATAARSILYVSNPRRENVEKMMVSFQTTLFKTCRMKGNFFKSKYRSQCFVGDMQALWFSTFLLNREVNKLVISDALMIFGSILFVGIWMKFYIHSNLLALCYMAYIFASLPVAMFLYKLILQMKYFNLVHMGGMFLMIGVGADGIFVVTDAWVQSRVVFKSVLGTNDEKGLKRLIYTYERASLTVFCTSLTTIVAFLVTSFSSIVSLSAFGVFFSLCLFVQYIFILTIVPSTLVCYHKFVARLDGTYGAVGVDDKVSFIAKFFADSYVPFILNHRLKILFVTASLAVLGIVGTTYLRPLSDVEQGFPNDHMFQVLRKFLSSFVAGADSLLDKGTFSLGIKGLHRDFYSHYSGEVANFKDSVIFDTEFTLVGPETIPSILNFCEQLVALPCNLDVCNQFGVLVSPETFDYRHICPIKDLTTWYETSFLSEMDVNKTIVQLDEDELLFILDEFLLQFPSLEKHFGMVDRKIRFLTMEFRFVYALAVAPQEGEKVQTLLNTFVEEFLQTAPDTLQSIQFTSPQMIEAASARALIANVKRSLMITFPVIFMILLYALNNYILALYTMVAIACINVCVLGFVFAILGWELGFIASVVTVMIVGLSVDYCIHFCHMYMFAFTAEGIRDRRGRFIFAATKIGSTVIAGGATTLGAGIFLFGGQLEFSRKMAIMLTLTISLSLVYSLFFLMPLISLIGPEGDQGMLYRSNTLLVTEAEPIEVKVGLDGSIEQKNDVLNKA